MKTRVFGAVLPTTKKDARVIVSADVVVPKDASRVVNGQIRDTLQQVLVAGDMNLGKPKKQLRRTAYVTALAEGDSVRYHMDSE